MTDLREHYKNEMCPICGGHLIFNKDYSKVNCEDMHCDFNIAQGFVSEGKYYFISFRYGVNEISLDSTVINEHPRDWKIKVDNLYPGQYDLLGWKEISKEEYNLIIRSRNIVYGMPINEPTNTNKKILKNEYSDEFDKLRQNRVIVSYFKYGPIKDNYGNKLVNAVESLKRYLHEYERTGNTEFLVDVANYAMFEFMYPQHKEAHFEAKDDNRKCRPVGTPINDIK